MEKPPFLMESAGGPKVIHIGYHSASVEQVYHPDFEVIGDIGASVEALGGRLEGRLPSDRACWSCARQSSRTSTIAP
ncbi:MAG: acetolactate synthase large subunit, partial [Pararhodobacter sp.]